jgi:hypothetical protein
VSERFAFRFSVAGRAVLTPAGVTAATSWVEVGPERFEARFGPWVVTTATSNITGTSVQGPHNPVKAVGVRWSFADHGLTFGSNAERTVCVEFAEPVRGLDPLRLLRHPNLSLAVAEPEALVTAIRAAAGLA